MAFNIDNFSFRRDRDDCRDRDRDDCRAVINKKIEVNTPVKVNVKSRSGNINVTCSKPRIANFSPHPDCNSDSCEFTVSQLICVEIPICYHVRADVGSSFVDCNVDLE